MTIPQGDAATDALNSVPNPMAPSTAGLDGRGEFILGIVVTFNTDPAGFIELLDRFSAFVPLVVCDNSTDEETQAKIQELVHSRDMVYLPMNGNVGIARAQNRGIDYAKSKNASFVLLIDDDSHLSATDALQLCAAYRQLNTSGEKVGAISARAISVEGRNLSNVPDPGHPGFTPCSLLNSSGTLIAVEAFSEVGMMNEGLFIDLVDFDWGWRALDKGYGLFIAEEVRFQHTLGEGTFQFFGLHAGVPSPIRHYYQTRNTLHLLTRSYVPIHWKLRQLISLAIKIVAFPIFVPPRLKRLAHFTQGVIDAIGENMGPKMK